MRVVVIDDTPSNVALLREILGKCDGCFPVCFTSPSEAFAWCERENPDLVLVDYMMPEMDGLEFIRRFKQLPGRESTPAVIITAYGEKELLYRALTQGASDFLTKPIDRKELTLRMRNLMILRKREQELAGRSEVLRREMSELIERMCLMESERERREAELQHARMLEAMGQFTAGIVHDFNNMLSIIAGYGDIIQSRMDPADPLQPYADKLLLSTERVGRLTRSLLSFTRKQKTERRLIDLNAVVNDVATILLGPLCRDVKVTVSPSPTPLPVMADPSQLEQVLVNLGSNARDAMQQGGLLAIRTEAVAPDRCGSGGASLHTPHCCALITVEDTGEGMNEETRKRIFEPFFTTKAKGRGTGLGLSVVHDIIGTHGGRVEVESKPGKGTSFRIYLPLSDHGPLCGGPPDADEGAGMVCRGSKKEIAG